MLTVMGGNNPTSYNLTRSLRFRSSASAYLNRTPAGAGNLQKGTWSAWVKRGAISSAARQDFFSNNGSTDSTYFNFSFTTDNYLQIGNFSTANVLTPNQFFRDPAAWYHIVIAVDTTQAAANDRIKIYINGAQVTSFLFNNIATYYAQNSTYGFSSASQYAIGRGNYAAAYYFDGYLAEVNFIDGQALTPSSFGSTNATTGVWQPARYAGTYGTNGFYLPFTDNSALTTSSNVGLGKDFSGNSNYWTTNNISITAGVTYDSMTDVPTLTSAASTNFCTMNPVYVSNIKAAPTLADANLTINPLYDGFMNGTIALPSSGKFYWEATVVTATTGTNQTALGVNTNQGNNRVQHNFVPVLNDVWGVAVDIDSLSVSWYKNNVLDTTKLLSAGLEYFPFFYTDTNPSPTQKWAANFGQRPFTYTPPTGYKTLNTFNLPTGTILKGNTVMDATLYTGTGATLAITNSGSMQPDFVWLKGRSSPYNHALFDSIRGANKVLFSNGTSSEQTETAGSLSAFNSNGFTLASGTATHAAVNVAGQTFVGWQWQAGQGSSSSNTSGTITSTVSVNASAGFSVVTYTGTGATATVGHGLGVAPKFIIFKKRSAAENWMCVHTSLTNYNWYLILNSTSAQIGDATIGNIDPTSTRFEVGTSPLDNTSGATYVAYCWAPIAGYSAFSSYTGNGSADGAFVYTGFRPAYVMIKGTNVVSDWVIKDYRRANNYNPQDGNLYADLSNAEDTTASVYVDFLSNGFKLRGTYNGTNGPYNYIYAAFAENPFKNALAR